MNNWQRNVYNIPIPVIKIILNILVMQSASGKYIPWAKKLVTSVGLVKSKAIQLIELYNWLMYVACIYTLKTSERELLQKLQPVCTTHLYVWVKWSGSQTGTRESRIAESRSGEHFHGCVTLQRPCNANQSHHRAQALNSRCFIKLLCFRLVK